MIHHAFVDGFAQQLTIPHQPISQELVCGVDHHLQTVPDDWEGLCPQQQGQSGVRVHWQEPRFGGQLRVLTQKRILLIAGDTLPRHKRRYRCLCLPSTTSTASAAPTTVVLLLRGLHHPVTLS